MSTPTECPGCGSRPHTREMFRKQHNNPSIPINLYECQHCGSLKCCFCDMGDDVGCLSCDQGDEE
jgi:uncharacterized Zn finger protein